MIITHAAYAICPITSIFPYPVNICKYFYIMIYVSTLHSSLFSSLLLASGISEQCVRVVLGRVASPAGSYGHAWVVYQCESGQWCLLETTLESAPPSFTPADPFTLPGNQYQYQPQFCLNSSHLWSMTRMKNEFTDYLKIRVKPQQPVPSE